jgi:hypothetical protein
MGDAVGNRGHPELTHAVVDIIPGISSFSDFEPDQMVRLLGARSAEPPSSSGRMGPMAFRVFCDAYGWQFLPGWTADFQSAPGFWLPVVRQSAAHAAGKLGGQVRVRLFVGGKFLVPGVLRFFAASRASQACRSLLGSQMRVFPAQFLPGQRHFLFAQRRAVRLFFPGLFGSRNR